MIESYFACKKLKGLKEQKHRSQLITYPNNVSPESTSLQNLQTWASLSFFMLLVLALKMTWCEPDDESLRPEKEGWSNTKPPTEDSEKQQVL